MPELEVAAERADLVMVRADPFNAETSPTALQAPITPTARHYVRSNFPLPAHDGTLRIAGAVEQPLSLSLDDLRAFPATTLTVTLECAGNHRAAMAPLPQGEPWTGGAVGTAAWTGVPLSSVLARAVPRPEAVEVAFAGADHGPFKGEPEIRFVRSLPLAVALGAEADALLAYAVNGEPLPPDHGAPLRLVVPRWYGMASVKWLTSIELLTTPFEGRFQTRSYVYQWANGEREPVTTQRVKAIITEPTTGACLAPGRRVVRGKAWSGVQPVTRVEVSVNAGDWRPADLEPAVGPHGWCSWSFNWEAIEIGRHGLRARATDAAGNVQPDLPPWNALGYGNNAIQVVLVDIH